MGLLSDLGLMAGAAQAATSSNQSWQQAQQWQQAAYPLPQPINTPGMHIPIQYAPKRPTLSDFDIELMAACISNKHPVVDGQSHCFCTLKRLERGISKD